MADVKLVVSRSKVKRVTIEYEDGHVSELVGEAADNYQQIVMDQAVQAWNRGARLGPMPWKHRNKNCDTCRGVGEVGPFNKPRPCPECSGGPRGG